MCSWGSLSGLWEEVWTLSIGLSATILEVILTTRGRCTLLNQSDISDFSEKSCSSC